MPIIDKIFTNDSYVATYQVEDIHVGMRIDQYIQIYLKTFSRELIKKKIKKGEVVLKERPGVLRSSTKVLFKDIIELTVYKSSHEDEYWNGKLLSLELNPTVLYEDDHLIVISKPPFMSTHPTGRHLFNCATVFFEAQYKKTIHSIHRLDRETSGVLLLGKNPEAANLLTAQFENNLVQKAYFFIARKNSSYNGTQNFWIKNRLDSGGENLKRVYINHYPEKSESGPILGKEAQTFFEILYQEKDYVVGLAYPKTGRQHQIRVHSMIAGLPLVGDKLYLGDFQMFQRFKDNIATKDDHNLMELPRHALHALALSIPYQKKITIFHAPLPCDLKEWIQNHLSIKIQILENMIHENINNYFKILT